MKSKKCFVIEVNKPYDYKQISKSECDRITKIICKEVLELANRFDGASDLELKIEINGKGNA